MRASRPKADRGFSFKLWGRFEEGVWSDHLWRQRLVSKPLGDNAIAWRLAWPSELDPDDRGPDGKVWPGSFLDVAQLVFALADCQYRLKGPGSAAEAFGLDHATGEADRHGHISEDYIHYCQADVDLTARLAVAAMDELDRNRTGLHPTRAYSGASVGKSYLRAIGVTPPLAKWPKFPRQRIAQAMAGYHAGRTECRIRKTAVPIVEGDFTSMYPTVSVRMGIWRHLIADSMEVVDATDDVREFLQRVAREGATAALDAQVWKDFVGYAQIPAHGEVILPVRADFGGNNSMRVATSQLTSDDPVWYPIPDIVASVLLTGQVPDVLEAWRLVPLGVQAGLRPVSVRGEVTVDPTHDDLYKVMIEQRKRLNDRGDLDDHAKKWLSTGLKVAANGTCYGILIQTIEHDPTGQTQTVHDGHTAFTVQGCDEPGEYAFPPLAAAVTAGAHLFLAIVQRLIEDRGGSFAFCDTDAMGIVATEHGGLIPCPGGHQRLADGRPAVHALSHAQVWEIITALDALHPYDRSKARGHLFEPEDAFLNDNGSLRSLLYYGIASKRYALYRLDRVGRPEIIDCREHGLGHHLSPTGEPGWERHVWQWILDRHHGIPTDEPPWLDDIAIRKASVGTPAVLARLARYNEGKPYPEQIKPGGFYTAASTLGGPEVYTAYQPSAEQRPRITWYDADGNPWRSLGALEDGNAVDAIRIDFYTYRQVLKKWANAPESKLAGPDGQPCRRDTTALLQPRQVTISRRNVVLIGKEPLNRSGADDSETLGGGHRPYESDALWETHVLAVVRLLPPREVAKIAGIPRESVYRTVKGRRPRRRVQQVITEAAVDLARQRLDAAGITVGVASDRTVLTALLSESARSQGVRQCAVCGQSLEEQPIHAKYCSRRCRNRGRYRSPSRQHPRPLP